MREDVRDFVAALGGYRAVATRIGKKPTTVHTHMQSGALPPAWYDAACKMAAEAGLPEPSRDLFSFAQIAEQPAHKTPEEAAR